MQNCRMLLIGFIQVLENVECFQIIATIELLKVLDFVPQLSKVLKIDLGLE